MVDRLAIKTVMKALDNGEISTEELLSENFFKEYSTLRSMEEFEAKANVKLGKGVTQEKHLENLIKTYTKFKNLEDMKNKAIEFYAQNK
ncbi:MAG: hypothetical protein WBG30_15240 [Psychrilyobacter sp.]|uniref:hypothetical protein n=1 Tax=Psychrilyobacter sp. TaxID=2586924 RepID=UPI003C7327E4